MFRIRKRESGRWVGGFDLGRPYFTGDISEAVIYTEEAVWMWDSELEAVPLLSKVEAKECQGQQPLFDLKVTNGR